MFIPYEFIGIFFVMLMVSVWYNHRVGFKKGAQLGYYAGIHGSLTYLNKDDINLYGTIVENGEERRATIDELTIYIHNRTLEDRKV